jgi:hypothetical protein
VPNLDLAPTPLWFTIAVMAAWRLTRVIVLESGPWNSLAVGRRLASRLGFGSLIGCVHCLGLWISLVITLVTFRIDATTPLVWLGVAGATSALLELLGALRRLATTTLNSTGTGSKD